MKQKLRLNGNTSMFHVREDLRVIMEYCNMLAEENELLKDRERSLKHRVEALEEENEAKARYGR